MVQYKILVKYIYREENINIIQDIQKIPLKLIQSFLSYDFN